MPDKYISEPRLPVNGQASETAETGFGKTDLGLLLVMLIWGLNFTVIKYTLEDLKPFSFTGLRFIGASLVMLLIARAGRSKLAVSRSDLLKLTGLGVIGNVLYQLFFIVGVNHTRAGNAALILSTSPLFTALMGRLRKQEYFTPRGVAGLLMAFTGIAIIMVAGHREVSVGETLLGDGLLIVATLCWSLYTVLAKRQVQVHGSLKATTIMMVMGTPILLLACIPELSRQDWGRVRLISWGGLAFSAVLAIAVSYILWNHGVKKIGATRTAVYSNMTPVVALLVAWPALGEVPALGQLAGAVIILAGIYLVRGGMIHTLPAPLVEAESEEISLQPGRN